MERKGFKPSKPALHVRILGDEWHGKTTLTTAIIAVQALHGLANHTPYDEINAAPEEIVDGMIVHRAHLEYESEKRAYSHIDCPTHAETIKNLIVGAAQTHSAILVVDVTEGPTSKTKAQLCLAKKVGVQTMVVFLNKQDLMDDIEASRLVASDVRELLDGCGYCGDDTPVIFGSATNVLDHIESTGRAGRGDNEWVDKIHDLLQALDDHIPEAQRDQDRPFLMTLDEILSAPAGGSLVKGPIHSGSVKLGDAVQIVGLDPSREATVGGLEMADNPVDQGLAGESLAVFLPGITKGSLERGMVLATPETITPSCGFEAELYLLTREEGGRHAPLFLGHRAQFNVQNAEVTGQITSFTANGVPEDIVLPGDHRTMRAQLLRPVALQRGTRMVLSDCGQTVGAAVVTDVLA